MTDRTNNSDVKRYRQMDRQKIICLDTETTGVSSKEDEILQLSIVNGCGEILFHEYIRPIRKIEWPYAQAVHGISPEMVQTKRPIGDYRGRLNQILAGAELCVGYNLSFDLNFLRDAGIVAPETLETHDVMWAFARIAGKRKSLSLCAKHYGYAFCAHDSLADVRATLHCFFAMNQMAK